jgi:hypothetical protein
MQLNFSQFLNIFATTAYRDNFTESGLRDLHEYISMYDNYPMDVPAICQEFEETKISDLYVTIVDRSEFTDCDEDCDNTHAYFTAVIRHFQGQVLSTIPAMITGEELIVVSKV